MLDAVSLPAPVVPTAPNTNMLLLANGHQRVTIVAAQSRGSRSDST